MNQVSYDFVDSKLKQKDMTLAQANLKLGTSLLDGTNHPSCISPASIYLAMLMTYVGAAEATKQEFEDVLGMSEAHLDEAKKLHEEKGIKIANRLYGSPKLACEKSFQETLLQTFAAELQQVDFTKPETVKDINKWVSDKTENRINELISQGSLNATTMLLLVNALYLKVSWSKAFQKSNTKDLPFKGAKGMSQRSTVSIPTMFGRQSAGLEQDDLFTKVTLDLKEDMMFTVFMPEAFESYKLKETDLAPVMPRASVDLYLPKFKITPDTLSLREALIKLGLKTAFDLPAGSANFSKMGKVSDGYLAISDVSHKTFIELDEVGVEAAAATAVHMLYRSCCIITEIPVVKIDKPFYYSIQKRNGPVLFMGAFDIV